jgi:uncharacterized membrane protein
MTKSLFYLLCILIPFIAIAHEGHEHHRKDKNLEKNIPLAEASQPFDSEEIAESPQTWLQWLGTFHLVFLHFPIALIIMTVLSELLFLWNPHPLYDAASQFMLTAGAALSIPTALLGVIYSYSSTYTGIYADLIFWHMWLGIALVFLAVALTYVRLNYGPSPFYYIALLVLFLLVNATAFLGGEMTFGPYHMLPPI